MSSDEESTDPQEAFGVGKSVMLMMYKPWKKHRILSYVPRLVTRQKTQPRI